MDCREKIMSEDYADFIFTERQVEENDWPIEEFCPIRLIGRLGMAYIERRLVEEPSIQTFGYLNIPKLFTTVDTSSMESSGVLRIRNRERLGLRGQGVIIGVIDTGIDYRHPAFLDELGRTRILRIWDQTVQTGPVPENFFYGSEYTREQIQTALGAEDPLAVVPTTDVSGGHGTFLASIAAGREDQAADFVGAASDAYLAVVKLKPAKQYLRDFYFAGDSENIYQENDIMTGIQYLIDLQEEQDMPMVVVCGLGGDNGGHSGNTLLSRMFDILSVQAGIVAVLPMGNETNRAHHFLGNITEEGGAEEVEIRVPEGTEGFYLQLWALAPEQYAVGLRSPGGDVIPTIQARLNSSAVYNLVLEETTVYVDYRIVEPADGSQLVFVRFENPSPGVWTLRVTNDIFINGRYHIWLPVTGLNDPQAVFLQPNPETTLTVPSAAVGPISVAAYDHQNGSIYIHSGRGFTRTGDIKPELTAPGVNVYGALPGGRYGARSGTSVAAGHVAGAAALLLEWGLVRGNRRNMSTEEVKAYLIRGAVRDPDIRYPSPVWGYGTLDIYRVFTGLRG
ncbi:MAG: S8 family peptidase [Lachnospiraceae bacterium]|nr:S8 family peptidase [Lachnospiraceae bacterium]